MDKLFLTTAILALATTSLAADIQYKHEKRGIVPSGEVFAEIDGDTHEVKTKKRRKIAKKQTPSKVVVREIIKEEEAPIGVEKEAALYEELTTQTQEVQENHETIQEDVIVIDESKSNTSEIKSASQVIEATASESSTVTSDSYSGSPIKRRNYFELDSGFVSAIDNTLKINNTASGETEFRGGGLIAAKYGHYWTDNLHTNVELSYRHNGLKAPAGIDFEPVALSLNGVYDISTNQDSRFRPYVQLGIGGVSDASGSEFLSDIGLAYNAGFGVAYDISEKSGAELVVGYEYFGTFDGLDTLHNGSIYSVDYASHTWKVGYKLNF
jgi:hypothetical protein